MKNIFKFYDAFFNKISLILQPLTLLAIRLYLANVFFKAGIQKITHWDTTLYLFQYEYNTPLIPFEIAAIMGTATEILIPIALVLGVLTRFHATVLFIFNIVAVYSYQSALLKGGIGLVSMDEITYGISFPSGFEQHLGWGMMMLVLVIFGSGKIAVSEFFNRNKQQNINNKY